MKADKYLNNLEITVATIIINKLPIQTEEIASRQLATTSYA